MTKKYLSNRGAVEKADAAGQDGGRPEDLKAKSVARMSPRAHGLEAAQSGRPLCAHPPFE